jgi:hypothetical protein
MEVEYGKAGKIDPGSPYAPKPAVKTTTTPAKKSTASKRSTKK